MPAYRWGVKIFLSVVERIFPSGLVRLLLAAFPMQKNNPEVAQRANRGKETN
jgi:hypothetical protein